MASPILEARGVTRQQMQNVTNMELRNFGVDSLSLEVSSKDSSIQVLLEEKRVVVEKSNAVAVALQGDVREPETLDQWSEEDGEKGTVKELVDEEDVSFGDLDIDNDDDDVSSRHARSKSAHDAYVSSSDGYNKWVQLNQDSQAHGEKSKAVRPTS